MTKSSSAATIAAMLGAFAISFFATVLFRRSAPSAEVAPSTWTPNAERAAQAREREEALSRSVAALRMESRRVSEQIARKSEQLSVRLSKARAEGAAQGDAKPGQIPDAMGPLMAKMLIREKLRMAREEYGMNASQLETYEGRLKEAFEKEPLSLFESDNSWKFDEEVLIPLLDRDQYAKYQERAKQAKETQSKSEIQKTVDQLSVNEETAAKVNAVLKEEGLDDPSLFLEAVGKPEQAQALIPKVAAATDRVRSRLRPQLSPEAFQKLEQRFEQESYALKVLVEELRKQNEK
jgi:hypothetical protein